MKLQTTKLLMALALTISAFANATGETLQECQELAQQNYPLIKRSGMLQQAQQYTLSNISKGWLPQISVTAQGTYQSKVVALPDEMLDMLQQMGSEMKGLKKDQYKIGIEVQQTLYDGGNISARRAESQAQLAVDMAKTDVELYAIRSKVNDLYFSILLLDERLALNAEKQRLLQANEDRLEQMLKGGVAMECDRDAVRAERLSTKQQAALLNMQREAALGMLNLFCGSNITQLHKPEHPALPASGITNDVRRPELTLYDSQIALTQSSEKVLKSGLMPKLGLFAQGYYGYPGYNMYDDMFRHRFTLNGMVGARVTWNIGNLYSHKNNMATLANRREQIENDRETFLLNTRIGSAQERSMIDGYNRVVSDDDEIIGLLTDVRLATEAKLKHGIIDVTSLIQQIVNENQAKINKSNHEIEQLQHIYNLKYINNY
ncbi:MAG: TolC family protein [Muribaculaceae bacterium]